MFTVVVGAAAVAVASGGLGTGVAQADPQATIPIACDRPNTGITAGLVTNLNNEIPDPINSDSLMRVVDVERPATGTSTRVELELPFPDMAGGFPPNDFGVTYGTFYIQSVEITVPIPSGYDLATVTPTESPDKSYVTARRSGSNLVVRVQSPVSGSRIRIDTEAASPVAEVETSTGVWTPVVMPTIVVTPTVTAPAGSTITWRAPSSSNLVVKWNRNFGFLIGSINWNDLSMPCVPTDPNQVVATTLVGSPGLAVSTTADESAVVAGSPVHLHVTATNTGDVPLTGVVVTNAGAPGCAGAPGTLAVGAHVTLDCAIATSNADIPTFTNTAGADANETAPVTSNTVSVTVASAASTGISGTITEAGSGAPLAGGWVAIMRTSDFSLVGGAVADASGNFSAAVPVGAYYLYGLDPSGRHVAGFHGTPLPTLVPVTPGVRTDADPALAPNRGAVAGTVTESGSAAAVAGGWVLALDGRTAALESMTSANGAGQYTLADLATGRHFLAYLDRTGAHRPVFHGGTPGVVGSTPVVVTGGATAAADGSVPAQAVAGTGATLAGTVTETGSNTALSGVSVIALRAADFAMVRATQTDGTGGYTLDLPAGQYKLMFLDGAGHHHPEWFDDQPASGLGTAQSVAAPGTANATLDRNEGTMAGIVTDDPSGLPVAGAWVVAIGPNGVAGGAITRADGTYSVPGLPAGSYRAAFVDPNGGRIQEYWNNAGTYANAAPLTIAGGATTTIDAALHLP